MKNLKCRGLLCLLLVFCLLAGCTPSPAPAQPAEPAAPVAPPMPEVLTPSENTAPPVPEDAEDFIFPAELPKAEEPVPSPAEPTPAPIEPTPAPTEPTPAPVEPTPAPVVPAKPAFTGDYLVGFGREDITPMDSVPLAGYGDTSKRINEEVTDDLLATAIAVTDKSGNSVILYTLDIINARDAVVKGIRTTVSERTGVPAENIFITHTHTHSGPDLSNTASGFITLYQEMLIESAIEAGVQAWEDRKSATMYTAKADANGLNFIRHYRHEDGTYSGPGFGSSTTPKIGHAGAADPELRLIRFQRQGGKDVLLMNWQAHATMNSYQVPNKGLSADFITGLRAYLEAELDCSFAYYQGAAGDHMPTSDIAAEDPTRDVYEFGEMLGTVVKTALQQQKKMAAGAIKVQHVPFTARINHADDHLVEQATLVQKYISDKGGNSGATAYAQTLGLISYHHANSIVRRAKMADTTTLNCAVLSIGDVGFAASPNELFGDMGIEMRRGSPYDMTFILGYCNYSNGYMPTRRAYAYSSYEVGCSNYAEGVAEEHAAFMAQSLKNLKNG